MGSPAASVFLTGATGFLGSHLCYAFLRRGYRVITLARSSKGVPSRDRLLKVLGQLLVDQDDVSRVAEQLEVLEGDLGRPRLGLSASKFSEVIERVDETWHSAASLSFLEEDREAIFEMNVGGTEKILDLVSRTKSGRLHHVSTAYISGDRVGVVMEDECDIGQGFKNPYEESKCSAEVLVAKEHLEGRVRASIYRPSIIIGDSDAGRATHFHGVYAFIRGLWALTHRLRKKQGGGNAVQLPLRVRGSEDSTLNFVPIDYVTEAMLALGTQTSSEGRTFHVTNPEPTPNHIWLHIVCDQLGVEGIRLAGDEEFQTAPMTRVESLFDRQMAFYCPYLSAEPRFDCRHALEGLKDTSIRCPKVTPEFARKMTGWYIDQLNRNGTSG